MEKELVKKAFREAEDSLKDKQVGEVKKIVLKTLEKIESLKTDKEKAQENVKEIEEKIKLLKMDIDDLKEGRLDRIEERQAKDEKAKAVSVVIIIKETRVEHEYPWWNWPYRVFWQEPIYQVPSVWVGNATNSSYITNTNCMGDTYKTMDYCNTLTSSSAKWGTPGAYTLTSGTVNLR